MNITNRLRAYQREKAKEFTEELDSQKRAMAEYLDSEAYQRDMWEAQEERWAKKAAREGWTYNKKPFICAADRQRIQEQKRVQEIAYLKEKIKAMGGE